MDVLGCLPGPPTKHNCGAADALAGEVFAYGVAAAIAVLDVSSAPSSHETCREWMPQAVCVQPLRSTCRRSIQILAPASRPCPSIPVLSELNRFVSAPRASRRPSPDLIGLCSSGRLCITDMRVHLQVHRMKLATVLQGPHRGSQVSAVAWCPHHQPRDLPGASSALRCVGHPCPPQWYTMHRQLPRSRENPSAAVQEPAPAASRLMRQTHCAASGPFHRASTAAASCCRATTSNAVAHSRPKPRDSASRLTRLQAGFGRRGRARGGMGRPVRGGDGRPGGPAGRRDGAPHGGRAAHGGGGAGMAVRSAGAAGHRARRRHVRALGPSRCLAEETIMVNERVAEVYTVS